MAEPKKRSFKRLQELGADMVEQVEERLLHGDSPEKVAQWLQTELGLFKDLKPDSLKKNLERYRATDLADKVVADLKAKNPPSNYGKNKLAIEGLQELVDIQEGRVRKLLLKEEALPAGMTIAAVKDELRLLKDSLVELGKLQLETGVMRRVSKTISGTVTDQSTGETKQFTWSEEQAKLFKDLEGVEFSRVDDLPALSGA